MTQQYVSITISPEQRRSAIQGLEKLTAREKEILHDIVNNRTCKEIARLRGIAPRTAEAHKNNIMIKMGTHRTIEILQVLYVLATESHEEIISPKRTSEIKLTQRREEHHRRHLDEFS